MVETDPMLDFDTATYCVSPHCEESVGEFGACYETTMHGDESEKFSDDSIYAPGWGSGELGETMPDLDDDQEFETNLSLARNGCREAQGKIIESLHAFLLMLASDRIRSDKSGPTPFEVVKACNIQAIMAFADFKGTTKRELRAWLTSLLLNTLVERRDPLQYTQSDTSTWNTLPQNLEGIASGQLTSSDILHSDHRRGRLNGLLATLPEQLRQVIELRHFQNLTFSEIAEKMGCNSNFASRIWLQALDELSKKVTSGSEW